MACAFNLITQKAATQRSLARERRRDFTLETFAHIPPAAPAQQPLPSSCLLLACWPVPVHIASAVWKGLAAVSEPQLHSLITGHYSGRVVTWQVEEK